MSLSNFSAFIRFNLIIALFKAMTTVLLLTDRSKIVEGGLNIKKKNKISVFDMHMHKKISMLCILSTCMCCVLLRVKLSGVRQSKIIITKELL